VRRIEGSGLDLIHHPHYAAPVFGRVPMVATIHDLIHQLFPELCPSRLAWQVSRMLARRTAGRAKLLLTVSEHSRSDIINHLRASPGKVRLTYNALPPDWGKSLSPEPPPGIGAEVPFFLYVGNHKEHKNIPLLLEAFAGVRERALGVHLALTGERGGLKQDLARLQLGNEVVFLGDVSHERLEAIYAAARALVFPSRYEGFGYPPLEAMGCGTPAIVSDAAALPEVVGEAGLIVPVGEVAPLRDAMMRLLEDDALRTSLSEKSRARAAEFSWRALAEDTMKAYHDVLAIKEAG
jgi:glycosyltransferase involved in cell wall biosynthesis